MPRISRRKKPQQAPVHERKATTDFLLNAQMTPVEVKNPYDKDGGTIIVMASVRDDLLRRLNTSKEPIENALFEAGRAWERDWQYAQGGHSSGSQFMERVDGGGFNGDVLSEKQREAMRRLAIADRELGQVGCVIVRDILGRNMDYEAVAIKHRGDAGDRAVRYVRDRFKECLKVLAIAYTNMGRASNG